MGVLGDIMRQAEERFRRENEPAYAAWQDMRRMLHPDVPTMPAGNNMSSYDRNASMDRDRYGCDLDDD